MSMEPKSALNVLYQAATQARLTKEEHDRVTEAAKVVLEALEPKDKKKK